MTGYRGRVQTGGVAIGGRIARLVLLACTLFGLAAMHTIGHGGGHAGHPHEPHAVAAETPRIFGAAMMPALAATVTMSDAAPDDCDCGHAVTQPLGSGGMNGWGLCVAVLSALAIAVLLAAFLLTARTGRHPPRSARESGRSAPRAPPILRFGLTLATASVLRT